MYVYETISILELFCAEKINMYMNKNVNNAFSTLIIMVIKNE